MSRFTILTVCTGNVHRSPLAAVLLDRWASWYLPGETASEVVVGSAGTRAPAGAPMGGRASRIARALGGEPDGHRARILTDGMIQDADLVLVASRGHRDEILSRVPSALRRTFTFREAGRTAAALEQVPAASDAEGLRRIVAALADGRRTAADPQDDDVIDPQGLGDEAYLRMTAEQVPALADLARVLFGMTPGDLEAYRVAASDPELIARDGAPGLR